jgi:hypothetical protein
MCGLPNVWRIQMKLQAELERFCWMHDWARALSGAPILDEHKPALESAGRKIRGVLERSGARIHPKGWLVLQSRRSLIVKVDITQSELDALVFLAGVVKTHGNRGVRSVAEPILHDLLRKQISLGNT